MRTFRFKLLSFYSSSNKQTWIRLTFRECFWDVVGRFLAFFGRFVLYRFWGHLLGHFRGDLEMHWGRLQGGFKGHTLYKRPMYNQWQLIRIYNNPIYCLGVIVLHFVVWEEIRKFGFSMPSCVLPAAKAWWSRTHSKSIASCVQKHGFQKLLLTLKLWYSLTQYSLNQWVFWS